MNSNWPFFFFFFFFFYSCTQVSETDDADRKLPRLHRILQSLFCTNEVGYDMGLTNPLFFSFLFFNSCTQVSDADDADRKLPCLPRLLQSLLCMDDVGYDMGLTNPLFFFFFLFFFNSCTQASEADDADRKLPCLPRLLQSLLCMDDVGSDPWLTNPFTFF